jgi:hypothetical protein
MEVQNTTWDMVAVSQQMIVFYQNGNADHHVGTGFFIREGF